MYQQMAGYTIKMFSVMPLQKQPVGWSMYLDERFSNGLHVIRQLVYLIRRQRQCPLSSPSLAVYGKTSFAKRQVLYAQRMKLLYPQALVDQQSYHDFVPSPR